MKVIIFLAVAAVMTAAGFLAAFIWATRDGQFDDTYTPSVRMLFEHSKAEVKAPQETGSADESGVPEST